MSRFRLLAVAVCTVGVTLLGATAWAFDPSTRADVPFVASAEGSRTPEALVILQSLGRIDIPFAFSSDAGRLSAGSYTLFVEGSPGGGVVLKSNTSGILTRFPVVTRLAHLGVSEPRFVFDTAGDVHFLSEIHLPGMDGYLLQGAPVTHGHELVSGTTP